MSSDCTLERRPWLCAGFFSLAVMAKETAVVTIVALLVVDGWEKRRPHAALLLPFLILAGWFAYHYARTGVIFGNAEFLQYNLGSTIHAKRIAVALGLRIWHLLGHLGLFALTIPAAALFIMRRPRRSRTVNVLVFLAAANAVAFSIAGGAVLARYLLLAVMLIIISTVTVIAGSMRWWPAVIVVALVVFTVCLHVYPPYHYALDENLAYRDFVLLHESAARILESRLPTGRVATIWPATDELTKPYLGYVTQPRTAIPITDFSTTGSVDAVLVFATQYEPSESLLHPGRYLRRLAFWKHTQEQYFDATSRLNTEVVARTLHGSILWREQRGPLSIAIAVPGPK